MISWITSSTLGKILSTFFLSMVPILELRAGLPYGIALGLHYPAALAAAVLGNLFPVPFVIVYIHKIFAWMRHRMPKLDSFITKLEKRAESKTPTVEKYGPIGLCIFVAIPLPGTGAWTGALIAAVMKLKLKQAVPAILLGVLIAAAIMTGVTFGVIHLI